MKKFSKIVVFYLKIFLFLSFVNCNGLNDDHIPVPFIQEKSDLLVPEGEQVLLPCKTNVFSEALISWYKDDVIVAENLTYSFRLRSTSRADAGYYHCVVKTSYGGIRSRKIKLDVGYLDPPSEIKSRSFIEVTLGQAVIIWPGSVQHEQRKQLSYSERRNEPWKSVINTLNETQKFLPGSYYLQAVPFPQAIWTINNAPLPNTLNIFVSQLEQAIALLNIDKDMNLKVIRARLINGYGNSTEGVFSQTHIIQVKDTPINTAVHSLDLVLPPKDASLILKDEQPGTAIFECVFNARPDHALKVQWFKRGSNGRRELIIPSVISQSKLTGEQLQIYNQPTYKFDSSGLNRTLIISNILPDIIPSDYHYKLTQKSVYSEEYTCHAYLNGYNSNNVFEMNDFLVGDSEFISSPSSSSSLLSSAFSLYRSVSPISTTARLKLYLPPKIHFPPNIDVNSSTIQLEFIPRPSKLIVIETSASMDIQLPCELDRIGIPAAEIKWLRNGDSINIINKDRYYIHTNNTLTIQSLKLTDAGIFQCYAYNSAGEDFLNIWLKVTSFAPRLCTPETSVSNFTVLEGSSTTLVCPIIGAPTPEFKWYKETKENEWMPVQQWFEINKYFNYSSKSLNKAIKGVNNENKYTVNDMTVKLHDNSQKEMQQISNLCVPYGHNELKMNNVNYQSTGRYKCEARNYLGNETAFIYVRVYARTVPVHHLPSSLTAISNQSLSITCSFYVDQHTHAEINWFHGRKESNNQASTSGKHNDKQLHNNKVRSNSKSFMNSPDTVNIDPVITYFSRELSNGNKKSTGLNEYGSILHVNNVHISHQGFYVCEILSPGGNYTLKTEIKVISLPAKPIELSISDKLPHENYANRNATEVQLSWRQPQPTYQMKLTHYAIFIHKLPIHPNSKELNCETVGKYDWELFSTIGINQTVKNTTDERYFFTIKNTSTIFSSGSYCFSLSAVNFIGWSEKSYPVMHSVSYASKEELEELTLKLYLVNLTDTSVKITWVVTLHSHKVSLSSIKEYQVYYWIDATDSLLMKKVSDANNFINQKNITGLKPSTNYNFKVAACNQYGCGKYSEVLQIKTLQQILVKIPSRLLVVVHQTNEVEISFSSDYSNEEDYVKQCVEGFLIKLNCIDPPGCLNTQLFIPLKCIRHSRHTDPQSVVSLTSGGKTDTFDCDELHRFGNYSFVRRKSGQKASHHVVIVLKALSPYTLYEMHMAYVYTNRIGPFSRPAEVFRTHEDVPSRISNLMVNSDGSDGLFVEWDAPEKPNGQIIQYVLHYTEVKQVDWFSSNDHIHDQEVFFSRRAHSSQNEYSMDTKLQENNFMNNYNNKSNVQNPLYQLKYLPFASSIPSDLVNSQKYESRKYAGYYSLNRTTHRVNIESLISKHIYQIRMFALNTAGLSPVSLQLGFTSSSPSLVVPKDRKHTHTDKEFLHWTSLIHSNKHEEKTFRWLNNTFINFIGAPDIEKINDNDAEFSIEFELMLNENYFLMSRHTRPKYLNDTSLALNVLERTIKLIEQSKWPIRIQEIPLHGYQETDVDIQIDSWKWRISTPYKYNYSSKMEFSSIQNFQSPSINRTKLVFSFKLHNLSSYTYYRIEVWQPVGLLFGNYDHIVNRKLSYSISSNWFKTGVKPPNTSPSMVYAQIIDSDRMKITWQPLSRENWNGIPKGFLITIQENQSKHTVNSFTTYPNHEHMFSLNGTINIQKVQSHCGLVYLQVFINDSTASDYTVNNLKCDGEYSVTIRAASIQTGISDKWLLGPEMTVTPVLVNKQVTKKTDVRVPLWLTKTYYAGYNLKVSYTDEWIILKWKESLAVECGEPPSGYHLIFKKISSHAYVNATFQYGDSPSYVKFIPFNDTNLFRSKTMQSSDSFYENVLKLSLKSFFDVGEICYFNGYLSFRLTLAGQSIDDKSHNKERVFIHLNLAEEKQKGRLLLRRIIPLSRQKHDSQKARVLITWIPKAVNQRSFLRYATTFTLQWVRIDPISYENLSLPSTRIISWPEANNHIMLNDEFLTSGALTAAESKSSLKQNQQKHYSEYLIAIDELLMDTTYLFQLIESNSNQVNNATLNNSEECSKRTELLVYVTTVESYQTVPKIPPATPSIQILPSSTAMIDSQHTLCPSTSIHLSWPNYLSQLQSNETTESGSGFIYTSPVTNYTLQYAEINKDNFHDDISYHRSSINYTSVTWANYYPSPNFGDENDFVVNGLRPNKMYIFRLAAQTDAGQSPFSLPTDIVITDAQKPCSSPIRLEVELKTLQYPEETWNSQNKQTRKTNILTDEYCEYISVKWRVLDNSAWNSQPGWYHIAYNVWPSNPADDNTTSFNLFVKHEKSQIINGHLKVELLNLLPNRYYVITIEPVNEYGTSSSLVSLVQYASSVLTYSGSGCNRKQPYLVLMKQMITFTRPSSSLLSTSLSNFHYPALMSKLLIPPMNFICSTDRIHVLVKCTWEYGELKSILGFVFEVISFGEINQEISNSSVHIHPIFIKPNMNGVVLYSTTSITQLYSIPIESTLIKPYCYYKMSVYAVTPGGHGPKAFFPNISDKEMFNDQLQVINPTERHCSSDNFICTSQSPPEPPSEVSSEWLSRDKIQLKWSRPNQLNGKLVGYRVTWSEVNFLRSDSKPFRKHRRSADYIGAEEQFSAVVKSASTSYTIDHLNENTTYIFRVEAQTQSKQNNGWGKPACLWASTSYCWLYSIQPNAVNLHHICDFSVLVETIYPNYQKYCSFDSPVLRRPVVFVSSMNTTERSSSSSSRNSKIDLLNTTQDLHAEKRKPNNNQTKISYESTVITVLWSEAIPGVNSISHILIETRHSWNLNKWYSVVMINSTMKLYTFNLDELRLTRLLSDLDENSSCQVIQNPNNNLTSSKSMTITAGGLDQEVVNQMIAAAFADANVPLDSSAHIAIQFRLSPANQFQIGLPSQESNWIVINLKPNYKPFYQHWWFIMLLGLSGVSTAVILLSSLRWNLYKRQGVRDSQFRTRKYNMKQHPSNTIMADCCLPLCAYHINTTTTAAMPINNEFNNNANGSCKYPSMTDSSYKKSLIPGIATTPVERHLIENSIYLFNRSQSPFNPMMNSPKWDNLYSASPEILIVPTDSSVGSKAPSNRTISTSEVERFDELNHHHNNNNSCIIGQGVITSNPSIYPEADISVHQSCHLSPFHAPECLQRMSDLSNSTNNEMIINNSLPNSSNMSYLCFEQLPTPYHLTPTQLTNDPLVKNSTYSDQINEPFQSVQHQFDTGQPNLQMLSGQRYYDTDYSSFNENHISGHNLRNAFSLKSSANNQPPTNPIQCIVDDGGTSVDNNRYYPNLKGENIMTKSQTDTYGYRDPPHVTHNSLYRNNFNRNSVNTDHKTLNCVTSNIEMKSFLNEFKPSSQNYNLSTLSTSNYENKRGYNLNSSPSTSSSSNHLPLNTGQYQSPVYSMHNGQEWNTLLPNTNTPVQQENLHQQISVYKNNNMMYNMLTPNYQTNCVNTAPNNIHENLTNLDEFQITTDLEMLTSTEV